MMPYCRNTKFLDGGRVGFDLSGKKKKQNLYYQVYIITAGLAKLFHSIGNPTS